jgi:beta-glucanase (GH16 family)
LIATNTGNWITIASADMRTCRLLAAVFVLWIGFGGCSLIYTARPGPDLSQATLIFSDEFDGTSLDTSKWNATSYNLWTAENAYNPAMVSVSGGNLILQLQPIPWMGQAYSGGQVDTDHKFLPVYGYFEARLKPPRGTGFHASWWLWPDDNVWPPEMDIVEFRGFEPTSAYVANRWFDPTQPENDAHDQKNCEGPDYTEDFHIFGMDWGPEAIVFYIDGRECFRSTRNISAKPFRLQLDLALGGWAGWPPDETTVFPAYFLVDYVRVYRMHR